MRGTNDRRVEHGAGPRRLNDRHDSDLEVSGELRALPGGSLSPFFDSIAGLRADMYELSREIRGTGIGLTSFAFEPREIGTACMLSMLCEDFESLAGEVLGTNVGLESAACEWRLPFWERLSALRMDMCELYWLAFGLKRSAATALGSDVRAWHAADLELPPPASAASAAPALALTRADSAAPALALTRAVSAAPALELPPAASAALALELLPPASAISAAPALALTRAVSAAPALELTRAASAAIALELPHAASATPTLMPPAAAPPCLPPEQRCQPPALDASVAAAAPPSLPSERTADSADEADSSHGDLPGAPVAASALDVAALLALDSAAEAVASRGDSAGALEAAPALDVAALLALDSLAAEAVASRGDSAVAPRGDSAGALEVAPALDVVALLTLDEAAEAVASRGDSAGALEAAPALDVAALLTIDSAALCALDPTALSSALALYSVVPCALEPTAFALGPSLVLGSAALVFHSSRGDSAAPTLNVSALLALESTAETDASRGDSTGALGAAPLLDSAALAMLDSTALMLAVGLQPLWSGPALFSADLLGVPALSTGVEDKPPALPPESARPPSRTGTAPAVMASHEPSRLIGYECTPPSLPPEGKPPALPPKSARELSPSLPPWAGRLRSRLRF